MDIGQLRSDQKPRETRVNRVRPVQRIRGLNSDCQRLPREGAKRQNAFSSASCAGLRGAYHARPCGLPTPPWPHLASLARWSHRAAGTSAPVMSSPRQPAVGISSSDAPHGDDHARASYAPLCLRPVQIPGTWQIYGPRRCCSPARLLPSRLAARARSLHASGGRLSLIHI